MNIQLILAFRYLGGRKLRTALTTLAIVFGVLVIFGMNTLLPAFQQAFQANVMAAAGQVDATITLKTADSFDASLLEKVARIEGVRTYTGLLNRTVNLPANYYEQVTDSPAQVSALTLLGIIPSQAITLHAYPMVEGRFLQDNDTDAAVISKSLAEAIGLKVGDMLRLPTTRGEVTLTIVGLLPARAIPGNEEVLITLPQAQEILDMPGEINTIEINFDTLDQTRRDEIEAAILSALGEQFQIGSLASNSELLNNIRIGQMIFNLLGVLALLMGGFIIFNTFRTILAERRRDIGLLRALGASQKTIFGLIIGEGLIQGAAGTATGLVLGYLLGAGLIRLLEPMLHQFMNLELGMPVITPGLIIGTIILGVGITLLAGLLPAINATRVTPLEALRPTLGAVSLKRMAGGSFWSGLIMILLAIAALLTRNLGLMGLGGVLFILGLILCAPALVNPIANLFSRLLVLLFARDGTAQLAEGNLSRQPTRAAITASTTLIGMAILIMVAGIISSVSIGFERVLRKSLGSDFLLVPPSVALWGTNVGAGTNLIKQLRSVDGVEVVSSLRYAPTQVNGIAVSLIGIDPQTYQKVSGMNFIKGDEAAAYAALAQGRNAIINGVLATAAGVRVGDNIDLLTPKGRQAYQVVASAGDYLNAKIATVYISQTNLSRDFGRDEDIFIQVNLSQGADAQAVEKNLKELLKSYPQFRLINGQEFIEENLKIFDAAFAGMIALGIFLAVPSLIAMVNTLAIGVIERTREIGMLRAVGATRWQVRRTVTMEALILAGIGTAFGVLSGLYLGYLAVGAMSAAGFPMEWAFPAEGVLLALAAGIAFGVLAAIIPARQAAQLEIIQALRYE